MSRQPVLFVAHVTLAQALDGGPYARALAAFGATVAPPRAALLVSSHWSERGPLGITSGERSRIAHDGAGALEALRALGTSAPGAPAVAERAALLLRHAGLAARLDASLPLDPCGWLPLRLLFPVAEVPAVQVAMPLTPEDARRLGAALAPLREEGVLVVASGGLVRPGEEAALRKASRFLPALVALGAARPGDLGETVLEAASHGNHTLRSFALRPGGRRAAPLAARKDPP